MPIKKILTFCSENFLLVSTITSVLLGLAFGIGLRPLQLSSATIKLISFPGELFMQVLKMMILPLIFASLISALAQMDSNTSGRMGLTTVAYYAFTAVMALILGITLVMVIHPGDPLAKGDLRRIRLTEKAPISPLDTILDMLRNMLPENIVKATFEGKQTSYLRENINGTEVVTEQTEIVSREGTNILGIIVFCSGFGIVLSKMGKRSRAMVEFFVILDEAILKWVKGLMWTAPLGILCLISSNLLEMGNISKVATVLVTYVCTVLVGVIIHTFVTIPTVYHLVTKKNPITVMNGMVQPTLTTLGTSSGGAVLPISIQSMEENCGVDRRIAGFVFPLGCTINMDGNALYEAVAVVFVAQLNGISLSFAEIITVSITATVASVGLNNVPAGLVSILVILNTLGLPTDDVALLLTVDWLLDRVRSALNVLGDGFATAIVAHFLKDTILPEETTENAVALPLCEKMLESQVVCPSATSSSTLSPCAKVSLGVLVLLVVYYLVFHRSTRPINEHPKVLLISLDGFRYDLLNETLVPNIFKWAESSTWFVNGVRPQYLTYTAPNHLSIVTGLYEESHEVVGNRFVLEDGASVVDYYGTEEAMRNTAKLLEKPILKGDPVWLTNERADPARKSTVIKWPFAEAVFEPAPHRPKDFEPWTFYGSLKTFEKDVDSVVAAFTGQNPSNFVALYVDQPDAILHHFGFYTGHFTKMMNDLDALFRYLLVRLKEADLLNKVNLILTADHGHAEVIDYKHVLCIRDYVKGDFRYGDFQFYPENEQHEEEIFRNVTEGIKKQGLDIKVYRKKDFPERYHFKNTKRVGEIILEPAIGCTASFRCTSDIQEKVFGNGGFHSSVHGQSPDHKEMRALLAMSGPDVREKNQILEIPQNIDLYPLLCHLLQVEATPNNGSWSIIGNALQIPILYNMK